MIKATSGIVLFVLHIAFAQGSIITFEPPYCITCDATLRNYEEAGVLFTGSFSHYGMDITGTAVNDSSGAVRFSNFSSMRIKLVDGSAFSIESLDLAEFSEAYDGNPQTVRFTARTMDDTRVSQEFTLDGQVDGSGKMADYESFVFSPKFSNLTYVNISSTMFSMDNLTISAAPLSAVPIPAAAWLFIPGLVVLSGLARRKSRPLH